MRERGSKGFRFFVSSSLIEVGSSVRGLFLYQIVTALRLLNTSPRWDSLCSVPSGLVPATSI